MWDNQRYDVPGASHGRFPSFQRIRHFFSKHEWTFFIIIALSLVSVMIYQNTYETKLMSELRPLSTRKIMTRSPEIHPYPTGIKSIALVNGNIKTNIAILTYVSSSQAGNHHSSNDSPQQKAKAIVHHPFATDFIPSFIETVDQNICYTLYVGFDTDDLLFDCEQCRVALDSHIGNL